MERPNCLLGGCAQAGCCRKACQGCGFDQSEDRLRRMILAQRGLQRDPKTGLLRLGLRRRRQT